MTEPLTLVGLDAIGDHFGRNRSTIRRWILHEGFPACRLPDGAWTTTAALVDEWLRSRIIEAQESVAADQPDGADPDASSSDGIESASRIDQMLRELNTPKSA